MVDRFAYLVAGSLVLSSCATAPRTTKPAPVAGPEDPLAFVEVVVGDLHGCARTVDGHVACWGSNHRAQLGDPSRPARDDLDDAVFMAFPRLVPGLDDVVELVASTDHTCARRADGSVRCWGEGAAPSPLAWPPIDALAAGHRHVCGLVTATGAVHCAAWAEVHVDDGELAPTAPWPVPDILPRGASSILADDGSTCVRGKSLVCWSEDGSAAETDRITPSTAIAVAGGSLCAMDETELRCTPLHQLDDAGSTVPAPLLEGAPTELSIDHQRVCVADLAGEWSCLARPGGNGEPSPESLEGAPPMGPGIVDVAWSFGLGCSVDSHGVVRCAAANSRSLALGVPTTLHPRVTTSFSMLSPCGSGHRWDVSAEAHVCRRADGRLDGPARHFDSAGRTVAEGAWSDDRRTGAWTLRSERVEVDASYREGRAEGHWRAIDRFSGERVAAGEMVAGRPEGTWHWYGGTTVDFIDSSPVAWQLSREGGGTWSVALGDDGVWRFVDDTPEGRVEAEIAAPAAQPAWTPPLADIQLDDSYTLPGPIVFDGAVVVHAGGVTSTGQMDAGVPVGAWSGTWDATGDPAWATTYGDAASPVEVRDESGQLILEGACLHGYHVGDFRVTQSLDRLGVTGRFNEGGGIVGTWTWTGPGERSRTKTFDAVPAIGSVGVDPLDGTSTLDSMAEPACANPPCGDGRLPTGVDQVRDALTCPALLPW